MEYSAAQLSYLQHLDIDVWVTRAANEPLPANHTAQQEPAINHMSALAGIVNDNQAPAAKTSLLQQAPTQQPIAHTVQSNQMAPEQAPIQTSVPATIQPNAQEKPASFGGLKAPSFPKAEVSTVGVQEAAQAEGSQQVPHYTLQFWCYSSGLWLVSAENQLAPSHHMLAHNIAHFVHGKKRKPRHVGIFSWPMLAAPNVDQSAEVAQKYLAQHIAQLSGMVECKKLLVFNEVSDILSQHSAIQMPVSLNQLLSEPMLKKQLWQFLLSHQIES